MNNPPAVLVFAHSEVQKEENKSFSYRIHLFKLLNRRSVQVAKNSELPNFLYAENEQKGDSFYKRFVNAIKEIYAGGSEKVITIGNNTSL